MKGLVFSEPMVKAWLAGNKDVTRRLMNPQPKFYGSGCWYPDDPCWLRSKHYSGENHFKKGAGIDFARYKIGEVVYIKETWAVHADDEMTNFHKGAMVFYKADRDNDPHINRWRSPMFMPEWASRSHARIVSVRPERITEITRTEAIMEGVMAYSLKDYMEGGVRPEQTAADIYFKELWESLRPGSWERNDWVWRIELRKEANHADR